MRKRVYCVWLEHSYGVQNAEREKSYETLHFAPALRGLGYHTSIKPLEVISDNSLIDDVVKNKPEYMLVQTYKDEISYEAFKYIKDKTDTISIYWGGDDEHEFDIPEYWSSNKMAQNFNWIVTTLPEAVPKYHALGCENVILSQFGANQKKFKPYRIDKDIDVSFCGAAHTDRPGMVAAIQQAGIDIKTFGKGWADDSFLKAMDYIKIFSRSKININFAKTEGGRLQVKGRDFEVPACRGFLLTTYNPLLSRYYNIGEEIETYDDVQELVDKVKFYLAHDDERKKIAKAGYERFLKDHTYEKRFAGIFKAIDN